MKRETSQPFQDLLSTLKNFGIDFIQVSAALDISEIKQLSSTYFGLSSELFSEIPSDTLLIQPKLICLKPLSIIYTPLDSYYLQLNSTKNIVIHIASTVYCIYTMNELFRATAIAYEQELKVGVKTFSLTNELMIAKKIPCKAIIEVSNEQDNDQKVFKLI